MESNSCGYQQQVSCSRYPEMNEDFEGPGRSKFVCSQLNGHPSRPMENRPPVFGKPPTHVRNSTSFNPEPRMTSHPHPVDGLFN